MRIYFRSYYPHNFSFKAILRTKKRSVPTNIFIEIDKYLSRFRTHNIEICIFFNRFSFFFRLVSDVYIGKIWHSLMPVCDIRRETKVTFQYPLFLLDKGIFLYTILSYFFFLLPFLMRVYIFQVLAHKSTGLCEDSSGVTVAYI